MRTAASPADNAASARPPCSAASPWLSCASKSPLDCAGLAAAPPGPGGTVGLAGVWARALPQSGTTAKMSAVRGARCAARQLPLVKEGSTDLTDVGKQCNAHEQEQQGETDLLADQLEALGQRTAFEPFNGLKHDLTAVEDRNGQQIHEAERKAQQHQELQEGGEALGRGIAGVLGNAQRSGQVLDRDVIGEHAPDHASLQRRDVPRLDVGAREGGWHRQGNVSNHRRRERGRLAHQNPDADGMVTLLVRLWLRDEPYP